MSRVALICLSILLSALNAKAADDPNCFPLEGLSEEVRPYAEMYLANALRTEAIYTFAGPLKPVSEGFAKYDVLRGKSPEGALRIFRTLAEAWQCGGRYEVFPHLAETDEDGDRRLSLYLAHRESLRNVISRRPALFNRLSLMPSDSLEHVIYIAERAAEPIRAEALGALFGFPYEASQFFVRNERRRIRNQETLRQRHVRIVGVERTAEFIYVVDAKAKVAETETRLRQRSAAIRASYRRVLRGLTKELERPPLPQEILRRWIAGKPALFPGANCAVTLVDPPE